MGGKGHTETMSSRTGHAASGPSSPSYSPSHHVRDTPQDGTGAGGLNADVDMASGIGMEMDAGSGRGIGNLDGSSEDVRAGHRFGKRRAEVRDEGSGWNGNGSGSGSGHIESSTGTSNPAFRPLASVNTEQMNKAFGGQTWIDFLRDSNGDNGGASSELRAPPHTTRRPPPAAIGSRTSSSENPLPPLPVDHRPPPPSTTQYRQIPYQNPSVANARRIHSYSEAPAASPSDSRVLSPLPALPTHSHPAQLPGAPPPDRKRRLTTADTPVRRGSGVHSVDLGTRGPPPPPPSSHLPLPRSGSGTSNTGPIRLDERPGANPYGRRSDRRGSTTPAQTLGIPRRESDLVLPPWQPDADVTHCFVCGSQFTFFYRKHHCRKCGRVVCSACSPHRITIPRQFIVHPPSEASNVIDLTGDEDENTLSAFGPFRNPGLGGGEEVRVCNPCVPDPNYSPPPPYSPPANLRAHSGGHWLAQTPVGHGQVNLNAQTIPSRNPSVDGGRRATDLLQSFQPPAQPHPFYPPYMPDYDRRDRSHSRNTSTPLTPRVHQYQNHFFPNPTFNQQGPGARPYSMIPQQQQPFQPPPPPPRREIPEEDECPICGNELPPKGPENDEAARIQHVEDCIRLHSSSPPPTSTSQHTSTSLPSQRTRGMSNAATLLNANAAANAGEGASNLNSNRMSMSARGMYVYTATEKDCVDDEGAEAECVICFEEFEAGVKMARLVCFCKFHEKCIKQWWETKGRGACPTHQLHD